MESVSEIVNRVSNLQGQQQIFKQELEAVHREVEDLKYKRELYIRTSEVLKAMVESATSSDLKQVEKIVDTGLRKVVSGQKVSCLIRPDPKVGASKITIMGKKGDIVSPFLSGFGGGVWNVVSAILRVVTILRLGQRRRLFLDESFANLSVGYQKSMSSLLSALVHKMDFKCLLVTQDRLLAESADRVYNASLRKGTLDDLVLEME